MSQYIWPASRHGTPTPTTPLVRRNLPPRGAEYRFSNGFGKNKNLQTPLAVQRQKFVYSTRERDGKLISEILQGFVRLRDSVKPHVMRRAPPPRAELYSRKSFSSPPRQEYTHTHTHPPQIYILCSYIIIYA